MAPTAGIHPERQGENPWMDVGTPPRIILTQVIRPAIFCTTVDWIIRRGEAVGVSNERRGIPVL
jgi:hypothetical protein